MSGGTLSTTGVGAGVTDPNNNKRARSIQKNKFVDPDNSLFLDGKRQSQHDKSFNEPLEEKNRVQYLTNETHHISQTDIMKKRHNSTERSSKVQRPRSSKGYRGGYQTASQSQS